MEWTYRLVAAILVAATAIELVGALGIGLVLGMPYLTALDPVLVFMGVAWMIVGMVVSGSGRLAPPQTTLGGFAAGGGQASLSSEFYISRRGAERVARDNVQRLARGSPFMMPAILYGLALFVLGIVLAA